MRQLSGVDALHVLEENARQHMHTIKIAVLGPRVGVPVPAEELRAWARERLPRIPPLRWQVRKIPLGLGRPVFIDVGPFDVDRHVTVETIESPGTDEQLDAVVSRIASRQLPRDRPLWDLTVLEGLSGGRVALVFKIHHSIMDGQASVRFFELAFDGGAPESLGEVPDAGEPIPTGGQLIRFALKAQASQYRQVLAVTRRSISSVRFNRAHRKSGAPPIVNPMAGPSTHFNQRLLSDRIYVDLTVPLASIRALSSASGATVNDVFVTLCGGALRRYLAEHGRPLDRSLTTSMPVSLRTPEELDSWGNRMSYWYVSLGSDIADPMERLAKVKDSVGAARAWAQGDTELFAVWQDYYLVFAKMTLKSLGVVQRVVGRPLFNVVVSNVRGPRELSLAGAPVVAVRSMGPITLLIGLNITAWSYRDDFSVGMQSCREFMPDLRRLGDHFKAELDAFTAAIAAPPAPSR
ncbi:MAG TPA: wax ester/triacylglycerol synthase family O-acyltransferase [Mycobacteriales bacterium]|nr:wax ester/triacylglycerol synthase family O-acyltransferase [Mycobacteriales bacterium]HWA65693.1 wax ester/triacylglycerol synthase family O-acyltransferase [Mycobacteriales bacterium]